MCYKFAPCYTRNVQFSKKLEQDKFFMYTFIIWLTRPCTYTKSCLFVYFCLCCTNRQVMCQHIFQPMWFPSLMVRSSWRQSCFTKVSVLLSMWVCLWAEWGLLPKPRPWNRYTDSSHSFLFFFVIIVFVIIIIIIVYIIIIIIITIIIIFVYYYMYHCKCYYVYFNLNHQGFFRGHEFTKDLWY